MKKAMLVAFEVEVEEQDGFTYEELARIQVLDDGGVDTDSIVEVLSQSDEYIRDAVLTALSTGYWEAEV